MSFDEAGCFSLKLGFVLFNQQLYKNGMNVKISYTDFENFDKAANGEIVMS